MQMGGGDEITGAFESSGRMNCAPPDGETNILWTEEVELIRKMRPEDRAIYLEMARAFYASEAVLHAVPEEHFAAAFDEMMRSEDYLRGLILELEGEVAGYALLCRTYTQEAGGIVVWVDELYVRPEFQGRGLGKSVFAALPFLAPAARYRLEIEPDNVRAERLYRRMGFVDLPYRQMVRDEK